MENFQQTEVSRADACRHLAQFNFNYPDGADPHEETVGRSRCWMLDTPRGRVLFCLEMFKGCLWVTAAAGITSAPAVDYLAPVLRRHAAEMGARSIHFYTARRGLVRVAQRHGYTVAQQLPNGWELKRVEP